LRTCPKVVMFDMDGVLVKCRSSWRMLHLAFGSEPLIKELMGARKFVSGEISYEDWMRLDIEAMAAALGRPPRKEEVEEIFRGAELDEDAQAVIEGLKEMGIIVGIVSGGIDILAEMIAERLGVSRDMVFANKLIFKDGVLTSGEEVVNPLRKDELLRRISVRLGIPLKGFAYVGDSVWDINALRVVGLPILVSRDPAEASAIAKEVPNLVVVERLGKVLSVVRKACSTPNN